MYVYRTCLLINTEICIIIVYICLYIVLRLYVSIIYFLFEKHTLYKLIIYYVDIHYETYIYIYIYLQD